MKLAKMTKKQDRPRQFWNNPELLELMRRRHGLFRRTRRRGFLRTCYNDFVCGW
jgi:hypothetical protein